MDVKNSLFLTKEISENKLPDGPGENALKYLSGAGFSKAERLSSKKLIASLFEAGHSFFIRDIKIVYLKTTLPFDVPAQVMISIPKKNFPKAVQRNKLRRLLREAYRKNKTTLYKSLLSNHLQLAVVIMYTSKKITTFNDAENKIKLALTRLIHDTCSE